MISFLENDTLEPNSLVSILYPRVKLLENHTLHSGTCTYLCIPFMAVPSPSYKLHLTFSGK